MAEPSPADLQATEREAEGDPGDYQEAGDEQPGEGTEEES